MCSLSKECRSPSQHVAALAEELFAHARHLHGLTKTARPLIPAALAVAERYGPDGDRPVRVGRKAFPGLTASERMIVRRAVEIGRGGLAAGDWEGSERERALEAVASRLAAILDVAEGLDQSGTHGTHVLGMADDGESTELIVGGNDAAYRDAVAASQRLTLWNAVMLRPMRGVRAQDGGLPWLGLIAPDMAMGEGLRRIVLQQIEQFLSRTYGLAYDADIEYVHEMRVATRRSRAALSVFKKALAEKPTALRGELKWLASELGAVRDLDVFLAFLRKYMAGAPEDHLPLLKRMTRSVGRGRRSEYRKLVAMLDSGRFEAFKNTWYPPLRTADGAAFAFADRGGAALADQAPKLLKKQFKRVKSYSKPLGRYASEEQHRLRIECKRLRYTAEFLADIYPDGLSSLIATMTRMQDALGDVHDADVYSERIRRYHGRQRDREAPGVQTPVAAFLGHVQDWRAKSLRKATSTWRGFLRSKTQESVAEAIQNPLRS